MTRTRKLVLAGVVAVSVGATAAGIAVAAGGGSDEAPLTGSTLDTAKAAALEHTGGGTVTETEVGDDGAAYSVEVRLADGSQVEVNLDGNFQVIGQTADEDNPGEQEDGPGDQAESPDDQTEGSGDQAEGPGDQQNGPTEQEDGADDGAGDD